MPPTSPLQRRALAPAPDPDAQICAHCRFWDDALKQTQGDQTFSRCRRFPPQVVVIPVQVGGNPRVIDPRTGGQQHAQLVAQPMPMYPMLGSSDWCGEFSGRQP